MANYEKQMTALIFRNIDRNIDPQKLFLILDQNL